MQLIFDRGSSKGEGRVAAHVSCAATETCTSSTASKVNSSNAKRGGDQLGIFVDLGTGLAAARCSFYTRR
jgi:hypothetical protein